MAGGVGGRQALSSFHTGISVCTNDQLDKVDLFLHSNASDLLPYEFSNMSTTHEEKETYRQGNMTSQTSIKQQQNIMSDQKLVTSSHLSKGFNEEMSTGDIFANKKRGKTKKKSNSTISSNTSSSYSSSSGVESMTAGITGESNNIMSDKEKGQDTCPVIDSSKETMYAVGQWLRFLQMDNYLQVIVRNLS